MNTKTRCAWVPQDKPDYIRYHDMEWGMPVHDDRKLFEMLILERRRRLKLVHHPQTPRRLPQRFP